MSGTRDTVLPQSPGTLRINPVVPPTLIPSLMVITPCLTARLLHAMVNRTKKLLESLPTSDRYQPTGWLFLNADREISSDLDSTTLFFKNRSDGSVEKKRRNRRQERSTSKASALQNLFKLSPLRQVKHCNVWQKFWLHDWIAFVPNDLCWLTRT
jgi:hypothetical protein